MPTLTQTSNRPVLVTPAHERDAEIIAELLRRNASEPTLLLQPTSRVLRHIDEFVIARTNTHVIGCAQLHEHRRGILEIMSVAVDPDIHRRGVGRACVQACVNRALARSPQLLWLATTSPGFFARLGFERTPMWTIPFGVLLAKLGAVVAQPITRWPAAIFGGQTFMRWPARRA